MIDTSSMIDIKRNVPVGEQWALLVRMSALVESGHLAFPRQVANELKAGKFPDAPGVWAAGTRGWAYHGQPSDESLAEVLGVAQLTDPSSEPETEVADPYIVAMALEISEHIPGCHVVVVTEDRVDRMPAKQSIATACARLGLKDCSAEEFVEWIKSAPT